MSSQGLMEKRLSLGKAVGIIVAALIVIIVLGVLIGNLFFWNPSQDSKLSKDARDLQMAQSAVKKNPKNVDLIIKLGELYTRQDQPEKALTQFKTAYDISKKSKNKDDQYTATSNLGYGYIGVKNYKEAIKVLEPFADLYPSHVTAHFNLGFAYYQNGQYQKAVDMFKQTLQLDEGRADGYLYMGLSYEKLGNKTDALIYFDKALKYVPNYKEALDAKQRLNK